MPTFFDAHLDLAKMAEHGRDMHAPLATCRGTLQPATVTLPSLRDGRVTHCLATVFTEARPDHADDREWHPYTYPQGDADAAYRCGMRQIKLYHAWHDAGVIELMPRRGEANAARERRPFNDESPAHAPLHAGILIECADPIPSPDDVPEWAALGVIAVGMAWWHQGRYAGGNGSDNAGLTDLGRALIPALDAANIVHDASHLSQRSLDELLEATDAVVIASHSNCRALLPGENHRHLTDDAIKEIARRGGVIGINLVKNFLSSELTVAPPGKNSNQHKPAGEATIDQVCDHIEHVCALVGDRAHVGLGSDMDGGITADDLPTGIRTPSDLGKILDALNTRGWSPTERDAFAHENWQRFWRNTPRS